MTEPTAARPVPGPYRPGRAPAPAAADLPAAGDRAPETAPTAAEAAPGEAAQGGAAQPGTPERARALAGLGDLPVAEHVAVFEAEHARLQRELGTIDPR